VVDISDPTNPQEVGICDTPVMTESVAVSGSYAYLANQYYGMSIIDISIPSRPFEVTDYVPGGSIVDVTVNGSQVYLANESYGLDVVDVSNPTYPIQVGSYNTAGRSSGVYTNNGYIYVADWAFLGVYQFSSASVSLTLTPYMPPIQIPANGGSFTYLIQIVNNGPGVQADLWTDVTLPNGTPIGPIVGPASRYLIPGFVGYQPLTQNVPAHAPSGFYTYIAYVGSYPDIIWDQDSFEFEKLGINEGERVINNWASWEDLSNNDAEDSQMAAQPAQPLRAHPNPFNEATVIVYQLPAANYVNLSVYDVAGRQVAALVNGWRAAGVHEVTFDGAGLVSGIYFVILSAGESHLTRKLILLK
jgi:hypothetical protein